MYSNKENINILTSLLVAYGIKEAVVCPGSRNAAIVHNLNECESMTCYPVTDERSAAFFALGLAQASGLPTVVCVTSGSALLNTAPAVAEAFYQHLPLIVIAADRPQQWIDQLDGQTLPQPDALGKLVRRAVQLVEPHNEEERWYCSRLVNEALFASTLREAAPVLINVPITEPLFEFNTESLPVVRPFKALGTPNCNLTNTSVNALQEQLYGAKRPMIVIGQLAYDDLNYNSIDDLAKHFVVLAEPLSSHSENLIHFDEAVRYLTAHPDLQEAYAPDYIIYIGSSLVSKATRKWLRHTGAPSCVVTPDATQLHDPLMSMGDVLECSNECIVMLITMMLDIYKNASVYKNDKEVWQNEESRKAYRLLWSQLLDRQCSIAARFNPTYSQMATVKYFEEQLADLYNTVHVHYANSTAIRLACIYAEHYVYCNRGVNGIEGSLSTAAGFATSMGKSGDITVCIIGDLSFFYDQNALWNRNIGGSLRILLLNNGGGSIFKQLPGLDSSNAANDFIGAAHKTSAQGICTQNDIGYLSAKNMEEMQIGVVTLLTIDTNRPVLLEVLTDGDVDAETMGQYYKKAIM